MAPYSHHTANYGTYGLMGGSYQGITILSVDREGCELHDEQGENEKYINSFSNSIYIL